MILTPDRLRRLVTAAALVRDDEIGCDDCADEIARFAEMSLAGRNAAEALPLVAEHLEMCGECRDEFEALLEGLRAIAPPRRPWWAVWRR